MTLDDLTDDVHDAYGDLDELDIDLDEETRAELAMLTAALDPDDTTELVRRAVHLLFDSTIQSGKLDFHLRTQYDVTYDEYLSGMTFDDVAGQGNPGQPADRDDQRRYQY
ncbi:hypothetical protein [Halocalculus aciditolerans]|uniref:Uncharacterized protein n=1 Tax=Halocalculus aciditolerans TaxID=1383812 RepID=A0A830F424_9EURY|nr:hypothetical protein [Halocalculus aciditolerans]GGL53155.1 hypothetical protein GCM10009039_09220 [Halocalculus aciditolerans]